MPRICDRCRFHAADPAPDACPDCGTPLKFTLLGPPNEAMPPVPGVPTGVTGKYNNNDAVQNTYYATPPHILSGFVPAKYAGPVLYLLIFGVILLIATVISTR